MASSKLAPRKVATILFDEYHSESWTISRARAAEVQPDRPSNSSYEDAAQALAMREFLVQRNLDHSLEPSVLEGKDVLVLLHPCDQRWEPTTSSNSPRLSAVEINAVRDFVSGGGGLFVVSEYEHDKYGSNLNDLLSIFGIVIENTTVTDRVGGVNEEKTHVLGMPDASHENNLLVGVREACFYRAASCTATDPARVVVSASPTARPKSAGLVAAAEYGRGRVLVVTDSDLFGDEYIGKFDHLQLWLNLFYWVSEPAFSARKPGVSRVGGGEWHEDPNWRRLKLAVDALRGLHVQRRQPDNSYNVETTAPEQIRPLVQEIIAGIGELKGHFPHDSDYLERVVDDLRNWEQAGFGRPDFGKSLAAFKPQLVRRENIEHLVLFPLYTPNNALDISFEAILFRVPWNEWLAELERSEYHNEKFVPGHLIDYTKGYDSECAVLFPETVSVEGSASNNFGVIFCDREAKRYQKCVARCVEILRMNAPPDLVCFLRDPDLVADMFAAWDLVHDASHSRGHLPFDPFMIRQLHPYWMYALEELRVDLRSVKAAMKMGREGFPFGKTIAYGVLFDRIFRFAISGTRFKNYDGLAGQLLFAALHKKKALSWEDNRLKVVWGHVYQAMDDLGGEVEALYDAALEYSRVRRGLEGHRLISRYLPPSLNSRWQDPSSIRVPEDDVKRWVAEALDDEFPLGTFHVQLKKKYEMK